jgi:hypothetical protein
MVCLFSVDDVVAAAAAAAAAVVVVVVVVSVSLFKDTILVISF